MGLKKTACVLLILLISGCATTGSSGTSRRAPDEAQVRTFAEIYRKAKESGLANDAGVPAVGLGMDIGQEQPYFPVYEPPRVAKVWVPAHVAREDKGILVAGHWTFVVVDQPRWYIEDHAAGKSGIPLIEPGPPRKE